jgi:hypothetical protein
MSSHREAPEISQDPVADNTDVYAFVSPDKPNTVTLITNYIPLERPDGGPNFYEFGDDVKYSIHIDNDGDGVPEVTYHFYFQSTVQNGDTFLYNTGPISSLNDPNWNKRQFYTVERVDHPAGPGSRRERILATGLASPPCNIGPRSTPNYTNLANQAIHTLPTGETVFAGQRADGFIVDLGAIFDLLDLRPLENLHLIPTPAAAGVDSFAHTNVHTIAIQVPISSLTANGKTPSSVTDPNAVLGVWGSASRRKIRVLEPESGENVEVGPWVQVSRLGNPLFNEVVVALGDKDRWNSSKPKDDSQFAHYTLNPEVSQKLPVLYPGVFPNLAAYTKPRVDIEAVLLTGLPSGIIPGFTNSNGTVQADQLRLNVAIPPNTKNPSPLGLLGNDAAGFPNGRRVMDDTTTIELRALAGATLPLVDKTFTPDAAVNAITEGLQPDPTRYLPTFPYLGTPHDGFSLMP